MEIAVEHQWWDVDRFVVRFRAVNVVLCDLRKVAS